MSLTDDLQTRIVGAGIGGHPGGPDYTEGVADVIVPRFDDGAVKVIERYTLKSKIANHTAVIAEVYRRK